MNLYILINSNAEGNNFIGIFESEELARRGLEEYSNKILQEEIDIYKDIEREPEGLNSEEFIKNTINQMVNWNKAHIRVVELNSLGFGIRLD